MASSSADADAERQAQIDQDAQLAQALAEEEEERRAPEPEPEPEPVPRPRKAVRFIPQPPSEFVQDAPKVEFVAFSTNALRWHEMRRVIDHSDPLKSTADVQLRSRFAMVNCIAHAMTGAAASPMGAWESFGKGRAIAPELWEMLSMALVGRDSRMLGTLWRHMLAREEDGLDERLDMPAAVAAPHVGHPSNLLDTIEFLALRTRKPRLLLELLYCQTPVGFDYASIAGHLTTIALAVLDGVFVGRHSDERTEDVLDAKERLQAWRKWFVDKEDANRLQDTAHYAAGWREVVCQLITLAGDQMPRRVETLSSAGARRTVTLLELAARASEFDDFFLERMLSDSAQADCIEWSAVDLNEAFQVCLEQNIPRDPEQQAKVLGRLYGRLLRRWRNNPVARARKVVSGADDLARPWNRLLSVCTGVESMDEVLSAAGQRDGGAMAMLVNARGNPGANARQPDEWMAILRALVAEHDTPAPAPGDDAALPASDWDRSSPLFASLLRSAVSAIVGEPSKTYLLAYLVQLSASSAESSTPDGVPWLTVPRLFYNVAMHHTELLPAVVKLACHSEGGTDATAGVAAVHIRGMQNALIDCMTNYAKEPARRLVEALGPGNLPRSVNPDRHGMASAGNVGFLALHVMRLGESAGARERSTHGPEFVQFVNQQIEKDFTAVLDAMEWTAYEKEEALQLCAPSARTALQPAARQPGGKSILVTKDGRGDPPTAAPGYNRAICARVLMARGVVPPEDCPYLQCIAANIFRPGELGAQAARERFEGALAAKRPRSP